MNGHNSKFSHARGALVHLYETNVPSFLCPPLILPNFPFGESEPPIEVQWCCSFPHPPAGYGCPLPDGKMSWVTLVGARKSFLVILGS